MVEEVETETNPVRLRLIPYNARLVDARKKLGLTQKEVAMAVGLHQGHISAIEVLRAVPTDEIKEEFAAFFQLPKDYLFPPVLMEAVREGIFGRRLVELKEQNLLRLTEAQRSMLLPPAVSMTEDDLVEITSRGLLREKIKEVLGTLKPREQAVLKLRFGFEGGRSHTLEEVGKEFGVTGARIREIEARALRLLRHPRQSRKLKDYL